MLVQLPLYDLTELIIAKAMVVHDHFGPGLFENVYKRCLGLLLVEAGLIVEMEKPLPARFRNLSLECGYRLDLLVENKVVVEVKTVDALGPVHRAQMRTYLRLAECPVGLIINFNVSSLRYGLRRVVNKRCLDPREVALFEAAKEEDERSQPPYPPKPPAK